jgi:hypothetical protein
MVAQPNAGRRRVGQRKTAARWTGTRRMLIAAPTPAIRSGITGWEDIGSPQSRDQQRGRAEQTQQVHARDHQQHRSLT